MKKVVVIFNGGLGNQLFQYAFCLFLKENGIDVETDTSVYNRKNIHTGFEIKRLLKNYEFKEVNVYDKKISICKKMIYKFSRILFGRILFGHYKNHYYEKSFKHSNDVLKFLEKRKDITVLEGYWQNYEYVEPVLHVIKNNLKRIKDTEMERFFSCTSVAVHVRGGDYLSLKKNRKLYGGLATKEYYMSAFKMISDLYDNCVFYIFTDDKKSMADLLSENIKKYNCVVMNDNDVLDDFYQMSICEKHIISNSTFAWWSSQFSSDDKIVMPAFFNNRQKNNYLLCKRSIAIDSSGKVIENERF